MLDSDDLTTGNGGVGVLIEVDVELQRKANINQCIND